MASGRDMDGYFTGVDYPGQLVPQMTPANIVAAAAWQGVRPPDLSRPFRMLDIGCGKGTALVLAAASHPAGTFEGIDGMESHVAIGRALAEGVPNITLRHAVFAEALADAEPDCDLIAMHGVLSWAGPTARHEAMDLAARRLKPGGLLAASYNALPGGARQMAFQHLARTFAPDFPGTPVQQFEAAFARIREMADARFDSVGPDVLKRLTELAAEAPTEYYLHEYMNEGWAPFWAADIKASFAERGLEFVGSVEFLRLRPDLCLRFLQAQFAKGVDPKHMDLMVDMGLDVVFRSDLYARAPARAAPAALRRDVWLGAEAEAWSDLDFDAPAGAVEFDEEVAHDLLEALEDGPRRLGDLIEIVDHSESEIADTVECLIIGQKAVPLGPPATGPAAQPAASLNARLTGAALRGEGVAIAALAGANGPVYAPEAQMGVLGLDAATMLERAASDDAFRDRFLTGDADLSSEVVQAQVAAGLREVQDRFARLGVHIGEQAG